MTQRFSTNRQIRTFSKMTLTHWANGVIIYYIANDKLTAVESARDLGVIISDSLKWDLHISAISKKAHSLPYIIFKAFHHESNEVLIKLFSTYVRPSLEYAAAVWSPHFIKDLKQIESVQRRFTKKLHGLRNLSYDARIKQSIKHPNSRTTTFAWRLYRNL